MLPPSRPAGAVAADSPPPRQHPIRGVGARPHPDTPAAVPCNRVRLTQARLNTASADSPAGDHSSGEADCMYEDLIPAIATATRIACLRPEAREAADAADAADAEIFGLLAESAGDPGVAGVLRLGSEHRCATWRPRRDRSRTASSATPAGGCSRTCAPRTRTRRSEEVEKLLRCLHVMWRLARCDKRAALTCRTGLPGDDPPQPARLAGRLGRDHGEPGLDLRAHRLPDRLEVEARLLLGGPAPQRTRRRPADASRPAAGSPGC